MDVEFFNLMVSDEYYFKISGSLSLLFVILVFIFKIDFTKSVTGLAFCIYWPFSIFLSVFCFGLLCILGLLYILHSVITYEKEIKNEEYD